MSLTYASERAVFFDPRRIKHGKCLMCATPTDRISPRTIAARESAGYGRMQLRTVTGALTLCAPCDAKWARRSALGMLVMFSPLWIIPVMVFFTVQHSYLPIQVLVFSFLLSIPAAFCALIWARTKLIQTQSIDEDGTIGLRNVHPDTVGAIVALGEADYHQP